MFKKVLETLSRALAATDKTHEPGVAPPPLPPAPSPAPAPAPVAEVAAVPIPAAASVPSDISPLPETPPPASVEAPLKPVEPAEPVAEDWPAAPLSVSVEEDPAKAAAQLAATIEAVRIRFDKPPDELCGVDHHMSKDEVRQRLAFLYKRYNRATSSLDATLRIEADIMLDAVVAIREKYFGPI